MYKTTEEPNRELKKKKEESLLCFHLWSVTTVLPLISSEICSQEQIYGHLFLIYYSGW